MEFAGQESFSLQRGFELAEREGISLQRKRIEPAEQGLAYWKESFGLHRDRVEDVGDLSSLMVEAKRSVEVCFVSFTIQYKSFHTGQGMSTSNKGYEASSASGCRVLMLNIILRCWLMKCPHVDTTSAATPRLARGHSDSARLHSDY